MSEHTPGPWFPINNGSYWDASTEDRQYSTVIASIWETLGLETQEANARLIASAPQLLEALNEILPIGDIADGLAPYYIHSDTIKSARSAIAKAKA